MSTSFDRWPGAGSSIRGRWNHYEYRVARLLGQGANGKVYLAYKGYIPYALKIGYDGMDLQMEVNGLRTLMSAGCIDSNYLIDVDDWQEGGQSVPFYVMKYVKGVPALSFISKYGKDRIGVVGGHLLNKLCALHKGGWVFGDLKVDNVLVSGEGEVELIDYGGVTQMGRAVRQFTELYDRGFWGAGSRTADAGYDLFAFALCCLHLTDEDNRICSSGKLIPQHREADYLLDAIRASRYCRKFAPVLIKAVRGEYGSSAQALTEWRALQYQQSALRRSRRAGGRKATPVGGWLTAAFMGALVLLGTSLYYFLQ
ncbi:protein kinase domain-containing protein [Paenibacillus sp. y28]|uniref:protein kinase domain-containing protein n=1 Tax=Paenibacillus sp. y28 TaxID=3129110 RepID=UPI0030172DC8